MLNKSTIEFKINDTAWYCEDDNCFSVTIVEKEVNGLYKVKSNSGQFYITTFDKLYEYRTRIDMEYKTLSAIKDFIDRRFYNCKEDFKDSSLYFCKILQFRFPELEIVYIKNKEYFVCCSGYLFYDAFGRYKPDKNDDLQEYNFYWVNNYMDHDRISSMHII